MMVCPKGGISVIGRGISPDDLLDLPSPEAKADADGLAALLLGRRSTRRFRDKEVDRDMLERVVGVAATAPMGIPPWDVGCVVVHGRQDVQRLAEQIVQGYEGFLKLFKPWVLAIMRPVMGRAKYEKFKGFIRPLAQKLVAGRREGRDMLFWDAPALIIFHHSPYAEPADATIACTYAMLAAESMGLGTTMIGSAAPILQRRRDLLEQYGIPPGSIPSLVLILGHPAVSYKRGIRRQFSSVRFV